MKRIVASLVLIAFGVTVGYIGLSRAAEQPKEREPAPIPISTFMQLKLSHAQHVLEGLALEDFETIAKHAANLSTLAEDEKWMVFQTPEYRRYSAEFQDNCRNLQRAAERKSIDGATLAYVQVTMSCVNCHKYTRGVRMAELPSDMRAADFVALTPVR